PGKSLAAGLGLLAATASTGAMAADAAPHRALYSMSLGSASSGSGITAANGRMLYKFSDSCDGWTVENRTLLTFAHTQGGQSSTAWEFVTWESKDGLRYRFNVRTMRDGRLVEEISGTAELNPKDHAGVAHFVEPEEKTVPLPKG